MKHRKQGIKILFRRPLWISDSITANVNYAAKICVIENIVKHPNADNLQLVTIDNETAIVDMSYKKGDLVIKFPLECTINKEFLSHSNAFENKDLNSDNTKKGFFNKHGRVRALKLRGVFCGCYIHPISQFNFFFNTNFESSDVGLEFTHINDVLICEKYVTNISKKSQGGFGKSIKVKNIDLIKEDQFRFHWNTAHYGRNIHKISPEDIISITYKKHGTSGISANLLLKRKLNLLEKLLKYVGIEIQETQYGFVSASRKVIKSVDEENLSNNQHYYKEDIWGKVTEHLKPYIEPGITLYYEIVGFTPKGGYIQDQYDYGFSRNVEDGVYCIDGKCDPIWTEGQHYGVYIYRITYTTPQGRVIEFDWSMVKEYCNNYKLKHVLEIYHGKAKDFAPNSEEITAKIYKEIEKECYLCKNKVPTEGYVIRRETNTVESFKIKSELFRLHESKQLDKEQDNIEE